MFRFGEAGRFKFVDRIHGIGRDAFSFGFEPFDSYEFICIDIQRITEAVVSAKYNFQTRIVLIGQQDETDILILSQIVLFAVGGLEAETFQVRVILLIGIIKCSGPYLMGIEFLNDAHIVFVVIAQIEVGGVEITIVQYNQYGVVTLEFSQVFAASIIVEAKYVTVEPDFTSTESRAAFLFQGYFVYRQAGENYPPCLASLDTDFAEVMLEDDAAYTRVRLQCHFDNFGFSVRVGTEIGNS